jgi:hypothetical protein
MTKRGYSGGDVPSDRAVEYAKMRYGNPGMSKRKCALSAGYSMGTKVENIEDTKGYRLAVLSIEQQRDKIRNESGFTLEDIAKRLKTRATDKEVSPGVQTDNDKLLISLFGYNAPEEITINQKSLFMEFKDLSASELRGILGRYDKDAVEAP